MQTRLYKGTIHHARRRPKRHDLRYRVFSLFIDLDELEDLKGHFRLLGINRAGLFSFWESDHGDGKEGGLKDWALRHLVEAGYDTSDISIRLLCYPRIVGYVFNPLSIYYCYNAQGVLIATLQEVHNTFGEKHTYVLIQSPSDAGDTFVHAAPKKLPVSPFTPMDAGYGFKLNVPSDTLRVHIDLRDGEGTLLSASLVGRRQGLSDWVLFKTFLQYPLMTLKVTLGIHVEALKLWLKGTRLIPRKPADNPISASQHRRTHFPSVAD